MNAWKTILYGAALTATSLASHAQTSDVPTGDGHIHHDIYITLKDKSPLAIRKQLELGQTHLVNHPGELSFASTVLAKNLTRHQQVSYLVNDDSFDVAFHLVFADRAAHDAYQISNQHVSHFIPESKNNWVKIRVSDSAE